MNPVVTVLMPVRDGATFLDAAVRSIRDQDFANFEFLIVDDGSRDATSEILRGHAREDSRIRVLTQPPGGIVSALNRGLAEARAELVARMDADDEALPGRLALQVAALAAAPELALIGGAMEVIGGGAATIRRLPCAPAEIAALLPRTNCIAHPTVMMRRDAVLALGGYRAAFRFCEDYDLWLRLAERHPMANLDAVVLRYRAHAGQATWRDLEQRIISELGAVAAAHCRRAGRPEPATGGAIDAAFLRAAGLTDDAIAADSVRRGMDAARDALAGRHGAAARAALDFVARQPGLRWRTGLRAALLLYRARRL